MSLPAILVLTLYGVVLARSIWIQDSLLGRYRGLAQAAIANSQNELAQTYYERVIELGKKRDPEDDLNLALAKFRSGDAEGGQTLLNQLAPDDGIGYAKAHRLKALQLVAALTRAGGNANAKPVDETELPAIDQSAWDRVRLHLTRSGLDQPVELADLWTAYFLAAGKADEAIARQMEVSELEPKRWVATARLCASFGDERQRKIASDRAEVYLAAKLSENPFDHLTRIDLARVYVDNQRMQEAGAVMAEGVRLAGTDTSPQAITLRRAASDFLLMRIESLEAGDDDLDKRHALVAKAIELDPNNRQAYGRLLALYQSYDSAERRSVLIRMLEQQIAGGNAIAMAHFALGAAKWMDGNQSDALWHTQRALQLQPNMTDVANNFAWLLAQGESPDLSRSLAMIETALAKRPGDYRYRDTRGTILMKLQRWEDALTDFESILPLVPPQDRPGVHQNLADIYSALGRPELAQRHRAEAERTFRPER